MENIEVKPEPVITIRRTEPTPQPKRRGRPPGVNAKPAVKKPVKKKPVKKPMINFDAIMANANLKNANAEIESLRQDLNAARLHIDAIENRNHALLIVVGYLEGKLFKPA